MSRAPFPSGRRRSLCHSDPDRYSFSSLSAALAAASEPKLLEIASDPDVIGSAAWKKAVRRDCQRCVPFVRFVQVGGGEGERFVAWFEPETPLHIPVDAQSRLSSLRRLYRDAVDHPDAEGFGRLGWRKAADRAGGKPGRGRARRRRAERSLAHLFASIFNPARLKVKAMQAEMPKKILAQSARGRAHSRPDQGSGKVRREMIDRMPTTPAPHHAKVQERYWSKAEEAVGTEGEAATLSELARQAEGLPGCPHCRDATNRLSARARETPPSSLSANSRETRRIWRNLCRSGGPAVRPGAWRGWLERRLNLT